MVDICLILCLIPLLVTVHNTKASWHPKTQRLSRNNMTRTSPGSRLPSSSTRQAFGPYLGMDQHLLWPYGFNIHTSQLFLVLIWVKGGDIPIKVCLSTICVDLIQHCYGDCRWTTSRSMLPCWSRSNGHPHAAINDHQCPVPKKMKDQSVGLILSSFLEGKHMLTQTINHIWVRVLGHPPNSSSDPKEWEAARNLLQATNTTEIHWNTFSIILLKTFSIIYIY